MKLTLKSHEAVELLLHLHKTFHELTDNVQNLHEFLFDSIVAELDELAALKNKKFNVWQKTQQQKIDNLSTSTGETDAGNH